MGLAGVNENGEGAVYHYDAIGSYESVPYTTSGSGSALVMSVLDCQIAKLNQPKEEADYSLENIVPLCQDVLASVGERDIFTGDSGEIFVIRACSITKTEFELKQD